MNRWAAHLGGQIRCRAAHHGCQFGGVVGDDTARDHWLDRMREALDQTMADLGLDPALEQELWRYLVGAAIAMVNTESTTTLGDAR